MSDAAVEAAITARQLFALLLHAQCTNNFNQKALQDEPHAATVGSSTSQTLRVLSPDVANPLQPSATPAPASSCAVAPQSSKRGSVAEEERTDVMTPQPQRASSETMDTAAAPPASPVKGKSHRSARWLLLRLRRPSSKLDIRDGATSYNSQRSLSRRRVSSPDLRNMVGSRERQWRADVHATLRRHSALLEGCLNTLLKLHVQAAVAAALVPVCEPPPPPPPRSGRTSGGEGLKSTARKPLPPIVSQRGQPCKAASDSDSRAVPQGAEEPHAAQHEVTPATTSCHLFDWEAAPLHVVSAGYAATVATERKERSGCNSQQGCRGDSSDQHRSQPLPTRMSESEESFSQRGTDRRQRTLALPLRLRKESKSRRAAPTLRDRLQRCVVPSSVTTESPLLVREEVDALLCELHRQQMPHQRPVVHAEQHPLGGKTAAPPIKEDAVSFSHCTVWESLPLRRSTHNAAVLSAVQQQQPQPKGDARCIGATANPSPSSIQQSTTSTSGRHLERWKAAWRRHRRSCGTGDSMSPQTDEATTRDEYRGDTHQASADPLCVMADGEWSVLHSSITAAQQLQQRLSTLRRQRAPEGSADAAVVSAITAYSPPVTTSGAACGPERVVVVYAAPPRPLDAVRWTSTTTTADGCGDAALPSLLLHPSLAISVEVEACHAVWLRRVLLGVAISLTPSGKASACEDPVYAEASERLRFEIVGALHCLSTLPV